MRMIMVVLRHVNHLPNGTQMCYEEKKMVQLKRDIDENAYVLLGDDWVPLQDYNDKMYPLMVLNYNYENRKPPEDL